MIGKNDDGQTILEFGNGDIGIGHTVSKSRKTGVVCFKNISPQKIGSSIKGTGLSTYPVIMEFSNPKSIDVLINDLKQIKLDMTLKCLKSNLKE